MTSRRASRRARPNGSETRRSVVVGENIVAASTGQTYEAKPHAAPPPKEPGRHRWIVTVAYTVNDDIAASAQDPAAIKFLDAENLMFIGVGCVDCERPLGRGAGAVQVGSHCPAGDDWPTS